jgi:hypothetical protein
MGRDLDVEITGVSVVGSGSVSWGDLSWSVIEWISCSHESIRYVFIFSYFSILFYFGNILACCNQYFCDIFTIILFGCSIFTIFCYTIFHFQEIEFDSGSFRSTSFIDMRVNRWRSPMQIIKPITPPAG